MARNKKNAEQNVAVEETSKVVAPAVEATTKAPVDDIKQRIDKLEAEMSEAKSNIIELVKKYNQAVEDGKYVDMKNIDDDISEAVKDYTAKAWQKKGWELLQSDDPMLEAAMDPTYETLKTHDQKVEGSKQIIREVVEAEKPIDPLELSKMAPHGKKVGHDPKWASMIEKLNYLLTCRRSMELGLDPSKIADNYAMTLAAMELTCFAQSDSVDKFNKADADDLLRDDLQKVVDAMIGSGYDVSDREVMYLLMIYQKKNSKRSLSVTVANHKVLRQDMLEICHAVITKGGYFVDYKQKKS